MASIRWDQEAVKDLDSIDFEIGKKIVSKVSWLRENFENISPELLRYDLKGIYKLRVGDYRVLYVLKGELIRIKMVDHRSRIYKRLR